ncbi:hypothetical protein CS374_05385 [Porphyromonas gingivalis]|nr:hypothetical protein CS374_05385 [Porphyromonas gingivalis]
MPSNCQLFSVHVILVREAKNSRATTKKFSRLFFRILRPQSEHFPFVFSRKQIS